MAPLRPPRLSVSMRLHNPSIDIHTFSCHLECLDVAEQRGETILAAAHIGKPMKPVIIGKSPLPNLQTSLDFCEQRQLSIFVGNEVLTNSRID
jgi:hypothetical protein